MKKLLVSEVTNTIYIGNAKDLGNGNWEMIGKKEDFTDEAIAAVFDWFMRNFKKNEPNNAYEIRYEGLSYVLRMVKEDR